MGVEAIAPNENYLGLPDMIGKSNTCTFNGLEEWVVKKLTGWNEKTLYRMGRKIIIKVVAKPFHNTQ
jgi:hypothetical protein